MTQNTNFFSQSTKQLALEEVPPVLLLQLKRFAYTTSGGAVKIERHLSYPDELRLNECVLAAMREGERERERERETNPN